MDKWDQDQLAPERWKEKSVEKIINHSWPIGYHIIYKQGGGSIVMWACTAAK